MKLKHLLKLAFVLCLLTTATSSYAHHILGGQMTYEKLNNNTYTIKLEIFRNCSSLTAAFDDPLTISVFQKYGTGTVLAPLVFTTDLLQTEQVDPLQDDCLNIPSTFCIEKGTYEILVELPPLTDLESYIIVYQRCCREEFSENIFDSDVTGISVWKEIKLNELEVDNNSPTLSSNLFFDVCSDEEFEFDISASDPETDSLSYGFEYMFAGGGDLGTPDNPGDFEACVGIAPNPPCAPPFDTVLFAVGYSYDLPFGQGSILEIDEELGLVSGKSIIPGQFGVGIYVKEYRNNELLSTSFQELTFRVDGISNNVNVNNNSFAIYPNPTTNWINIELPYSTESFYLAVRDLNGRIVKEVESVRGDVYTLDLGDLKGVFIVELKSSERTYFNRVVSM